MAPVGSITGRIVESDNRPVGHAAVMAFSAIYRNGDRIVTMLELVHSDDRGEYRLFSLTPGRYFIGARLEDLTRRTVPLGFYPPGKRWRGCRRVGRDEACTSTGEFIGPIGRTHYGEVRIRMSHRRSMLAWRQLTHGYIAREAGSSRLFGDKSLPANAASGGYAGGGVPQQRLIAAPPVQYQGPLRSGWAVTGKYYLTALCHGSNIRASARNLSLVSSRLKWANRIWRESRLQRCPLPGHGKVTMENRLESDPDLTKLTVDFTPNTVGGGIRISIMLYGCREWRIFDESIKAGRLLARRKPSYAYEIHSIGSKGPAPGRFMSMARWKGRIDIVVGTDTSTLSGRVR